jgi:hypothetical protein
VAEFKDLCRSRRRAPEGARGAQGGGAGQIVRCRGNIHGNIRQISHDGQPTRPVGRGRPGTSRNSSQAAIGQAWRPCLSPAMPLSHTRRRSRTGPARRSTPPSRHSPPRARAARELPGRRLHPRRHAGARLRRRRGLWRGTYDGVLRLRLAGARVNERVLTARGCRPGGADPEATHQDRYRAGSRAARRTASCCHDIACTSSETRQARTY